MKVAIVHEMLIKRWWAENVVKDILSIFPEADIFTSMYNEKIMWDMFEFIDIGNKKKKKINIITAKTTQTIYNAFKKQRLALPFMAKAFESFDLSKYDLVISSSSWFAHWVITKPETKHIVYYHSPARYLWDWTNEFRAYSWFNSWVKAFLFSALALKLRQWDYQASKRSDFKISASIQVQSRVTKYYKEKSKVCYPWVYTDKFEIWKSDLKDRDYYVITSALTEFKELENAIYWFNEFSKVNKDIKLKIIWDWNNSKYIDFLHDIAWKNIEFIWYKSHSEIKELYQYAKWFIMSWRDDFWISPIEAMSAWLPVFALDKWWLLETNIDWITWRFFSDNLRDLKDLKDLKSKNNFVENFLSFDNEINKWLFNKVKIREHSLNFSVENFKKRFLEIIE